MNEPIIKTEFGHVGDADSLQRFWIGIILLLLNVIGIYNAPDWTRIAALFVQIELLVTSMIRWCPLLWSCRINSN